MATTRNAGWGFALLATYGAGVGLPFWLLAGFSMSLPKPGGWMEWVKSVFGIALFTAALYYLKNVVPALAHFGSGTPRFALEMAALVLVGIGLGAVHASFHGGRGERARKLAGVALAAIGLFGVTNYVLAPKGDVTLAWLSDEPSRRRGRARRRAAAAGRLRRELVHPLPRVRGEGLLATPRSRRRCSGSPCCASIFRARTKIPRSARSSTSTAPRRYRPSGSCRPTARLVAKTDELIAPDRFLELLSAVPLGVRYLEPEVEGHGAEGQRGGTRTSAPVTRSRRRRRKSSGRRRWPWAPTATNGFRK